MSRKVVRLVTLAISTTVAALLGVLVLRARIPKSIGVVDQVASVELLLLEGQVARRGLGPFELRPALASLPREPIDQERVFRMFPMGASMQWDPIQYFRYKPHLDETVPFPEYPGGSYHRRTNDDGYREDHDTPRPKPPILVLATGDSHTDGIGENADSWANQLEGLLAAAHPGVGVEVLNAGVQNYSFYHYLGAVERALPLEPDVLVTLCYGGNDFLEVLLLHHLFQHTVRPLQAREYWEKLRAASGVHEPELTQVLYEATYLDRFPDQVDRALEAAAAVCAEIERTCAERGIAWVFGYLPSAYCLPWRELVDERARDLAALDLDGAAIARIDGLADRLLAILRQRGVAVVDLRERLRPLAESGEERPYWGEFHIDRRGQRLVGEWLSPAVEAALAGRR